MFSFKSNAEKEAGKASSRPLCFLKKLFMTKNLVICSLISIHLDSTMTTIEKYVISAIKSIKSKKQRADESSISDYILRNFGGDYMIPFCRDEILSRFAGIPVV